MRLSNGEGSASIVGCGVLQLTISAAGREGGPTDRGGELEGVA